MKKLIYKLNIILFMALFFCACEKEPAQEVVPATPTVTPTYTPSPTPTKTPLEKCLEAPLQNGEGTSIQSFSEKYLKALYSKNTDTLSALLPADSIPSEDEIDSMVLTGSDVTNVKVSYKSGIGNVSYFVYAVYDIRPEGCSIYVPMLSEFGMTISGDTCMIYPIAPDNAVEEALLKSRETEEIRNLYILNTLQKYTYSILANCEDLYLETVTESTHETFEALVESTNLIDAYEDLEAKIFRLSSSCEEADFLVLFSKKIRFISIPTAAPGAEEYLLVLDENNIPFIFFGETSEATDKAREELRNSEDYKSIVSEVSDALTAALSSDTELYDFYLRMNGGN